MTASLSKVIRRSKHKVPEQGQGVSINNKE